MWDIPLREPWFPDSNRAGRLMTKRERPKEWADALSYSEGEKGVEVEARIVPQVEEKCLKEEVGIEQPVGSSASKEEVASYERVEATDEGVEDKPLDWPLWSLLLQVGYTRW